MMHPQNAQHLDCRGQQCPQPILTTAKAARTLKGRGGGLIEIEADDDAFPLDIKSWCRSSGSELVEVKSTQGVHHAVIRVPGTRSSASAPPVPAPPPTAAVSPTPKPSRAPALDCRGMQCPEPILQVSRRARELGVGSFEVLADDPAFELDLRAWGRRAGCTVEWLEPGKRALLTLKGTATEKAPAPVATAAAVPPARPPVPTPAANGEEAVSLDIGLSHLDDAQRLARLHALGGSLAEGERVRIRCQGSSFATPLLRWAAEAGHDVLSFDARVDTIMELRAKAPSTAIASSATTASSGALEVIRTENRCTLLVLHNDKEALLAALLVANGAAAQGMEVVLFFTFWGLNLLRGDEPNAAEPEEHVSWMQKMMKWMMPKGPRRQKLGQMDMAGMGRGMLKSIMDSYKIMDIPELMDAAEEQGTRFIACTMSMQVMGITKRDLAPRKNVEYGGVAAFVESAASSSLSLMF